MYPRIVYAQTIHRLNFRGWRIAKIFVVFIVADDCVMNMKYTYTLYL